MSFREIDIEKGLVVFFEFNIEREVIVFVKVVLRKGFGGLIKLGKFLKKREIYLKGKCFFYDDVVKNYYLIRFLYNENLNLRI